mmetsp:Transcript_10351/g.29083  ORF Transcript_10351/g.29083 Transcript_10351/m.29083 type:complete len:123 (+) Transcript_10351:64-432(+)
MEPEMAMKVSSVMGLGYAAQMGLASGTFHPIYFDEAKSSHNLEMSQWFGQALAGQALGQLAAAKKPTKRAMRAAAATWLSAPLVMAVQCKQGKFKKSMALANGALCAAMGGLVLHASNKCDD